MLNVAFDLDPQQARRKVFMFVYVFNAPTYHKDKAPRRKQKKYNTICDKNTNNKKNINHNQKARKSENSENKQRRFFLILML